MTFELPKLDYVNNALSPIMSEETLELHHGKHHQTYITNLNNFIKDTDLANSSLEDIILQSSKDESKVGIFNNASQHWNHNLFWKCMKPKGGGKIPPKLEKRIITFKPNFIFHLAAQPLVGLSYQKPMLTWQTNVFGTMNILEALRKFRNPCNVVIITSDKCYFNKEVRYGYKETDVLGGKDPYSGSKASAEVLVASYINSFFSQKKTVS